MADVTRELLTRFTGDSTSLVSASGRGQNSMTQLGETAKKAMKVTAVAVAATTAALTALTVASSKAIDENAKLARQLGFTTEGLRSLQIVAEEAGISKQGLTTAIRQSQRAVAEAADGNAIYADELKKLGINFETLRNLSPEQQFERIAGALSNVTNQNLRTNAAMQLFGRQGLSITEISTGLSDKLEDATKFATKFGLSVSMIDSKVIEEANDTFARTKTALSGVGNIIAVEISPLITSLSQNFLDADVSADDMKKTIQEIIRDGLVLGDVFEIFFNAARIGFKGVELGVLMLGRHMGSVLNLFGILNDDKMAGLNKLVGENIKEIERLAGSFEKVGSNYERYLKIQEEARARANESETTGTGATGGAEALNIKLMEEERVLEEAMARRRERLAELALAEDEATRIRYEADLQMLNDALANKQLTEEQYQMASLQARKQYEDQMQRLQSQSLSAQEQEQMSFINSGLSLLAQGNKEGFSIAKAASIAQGILAQREAIISAYKWGSRIAGPKGGAVAAAVATAASGQLLSALRSTTFNATGGGGAAAVSQSDGGVGQIAQQERQQTIQVQAADPNAFFTGQSLNALIGSIVEAQRNGARVLLA